MGYPNLVHAVANSQLRGGAADGVMAALVQQYVNFADTEILPPACTWTFPTLGIMQYNKQVRKSIPVVYRGPGGTPRRCNCGGVAGSCHKLSTNFFFEVLFLKTASEQ